MLQLGLAFRRCAGLVVAGRTRATTFPTTKRWNSTPAPPDLSEGEREIYHKLMDKFSPAALRVQDISGGCGSFYAIMITSEMFRGLSLVKQHQLVNQVIKSEIETIHGLQLKTTVPGAATD